MGVHVLVCNLGYSISSIGSLRAFVPTLLLLKQLAYVLPRRYLRYNQMQMPLTLSQLSLSKATLWLSLAWKRRSLTIWLELYRCFFDMDPLEWWDWQEQYLPHWAAAARKIALFPGLMELEGRLINLCSAEWFVQLWICAVLLIAIYVLKS